MARLIVIALLAFGMQAYAKEQVMSQTTSEEQLAMEDLVKQLSDDKMVDKLVNKFTERVQERLDLNAELDDTVVAKGESAAKTKKAAPKKAPEPQGNWLEEALKNMGGGVTPTVTRSELSGVKPNRGMSSYSSQKEFGGAFGFKGFRKGTKTKAFPTPQEVAPLGGVRPAAPKVQKAFGGVRPLETLEEQDTQTASDSTMLLGVSLIGLFMGAVITFAAFGFRRSASVADQDYKPF